MHASGENEYHLRWVAARGLSSDPNVDAAAYINALRTNATGRTLAQMEAVVCLNWRDAPECLTSGFIPCVTANWKTATTTTLPVVPPPSQEFRGKKDMLKGLQGRFRGYAKWKLNCNVVVVIDKDREDCTLLKSKIEDKARDCGLLDKTFGKYPKRLAIRIAMTELEAWFLGDPVAVNRAFPKVQETDLHIKGSVDKILAPAKRLERVLQRRGYYRTGMPKLQVARLVAEHMNPCKNRSPSFRLLMRTLRELGS